MKIYPKKSSWIIILIATSFGFFIGIASIIEDAYFIPGYLSFLFPIIMAMYNYTAIIIVENDRIIFMRYFRQIWYAEFSNTLLIKGRVGSPPLLKGLLLKNICNGKFIGEIVTGNYQEKDIEFIKSKFSIN